MTQDINSNHDILWYGAFTGSHALIANVIRISARYNNLSTLEDAYGINLLPLIEFAMNTYGDDDCACFKPNVDMDDKTKDYLAKMHKRP